MHNFHFCGLTKITPLFPFLKAELLLWTRKPYKSNYRNSRLIHQVSTNVTSPKWKGLNTEDWWGWCDVTSHKSVGQCWFTVDKHLIPAAFGDSLLFPCIFFLVFFIISWFIWSKFFGDRTWTVLIVKKTYSKKTNLLAALLKFAILRYVMENPGLSWAVRILHGSWCSFWARVNFAHFQYFIALFCLCRTGKRLIWSWQSDKGLGWNLKLYFQPSLIVRQLFVPCYYLILYQHHKLLCSSNCGFQSIHHGFTTHLAQNCTLDFVVIQRVNHPARLCRKWVLWPRSRERLFVGKKKTVWGVPYSSRMVLFSFCILLHFTYPRASWRWGPSSILLTRPFYTTHWASLLSVQHMPEF